MRSKILQEILDRTPEDVKIYVHLYGNIVVRIHELLKEKGITQKTLAEGMGKKPSEISKWLNGEHNFTLKSLAKLEAELGEPIIAVPKRSTFSRASQKSLKMTASLSQKSITKASFKSGKSDTENTEPLAA